MITELYIYGLFFVAAVSVYSIIYSRTNLVVTFFLIPLVLGVAIWTWQAINILQGTPRDGLPYGDRVEVIWTYQKKPDILLVIRQGDEEPAYYKIPWTKENQYKVRRMQEAIAREGRAQGKFQKMPKGYNGSSQSFIFTEIERFVDPIRKGQPDERPHL